LEDKVIAKNIGNFGIILTRRYLLYIVMVIAAFLSIYTFVLVEESAHEHRKFYFNLFVLDHLFFLIQGEYQHSLGSSSAKNVDTRRSPRIQGEHSGTLR